MPRPKMTHRVSPFTVAIDTREQLPYEFAGLRADSKGGNLPLIIPAERATLPEGDYAIIGHIGEIAVERKSHADLLGTLTAGRERFVAELERLSAYRYAAVVVEAELSAILGIHDERRDALINEFARLAFLSDGDYPIGEWVDAITEMVPGKLPHSKVHPKTVIRSVQAYRQRYPSVHWVFAPDRRHAEAETYRILERWYKEVISVRPVAEDEGPTLFQAGRAGSQAGPEAEV